MKPIGCEIVTGARLHFGLMDTVKPFGGTGLMISAPATKLSVRSTPGSPLNVKGPGSERAIEVVQRYVAFVGLGEMPDVAIDIQMRPPSHTGLGSGTQFDMAVAEGLRFTFQHSVSNNDLAQHIAARGQRSAVGVHGYWLGGLLFDDDASCDHLNAINPLQARVELPTTWRIALLRPKDWDSGKISGNEEQQRFQVLERPSETERSYLRTKVKNDLIPAGNYSDFASFCEASRDYNYHAGMFFASAQGGAYNGLLIETCIAQLRTKGFNGVGQTSWGPTVFVFCEDDHWIGRLQNTIVDDWEIYQITSPLNCGRTLKELY